MIEAIIMPEEPSSFFVTVFGGNAWIATFLAALIPLIELRGAIPFGMSVEFWGEHALKSWVAFLAAFAGSSLVAPFVALIFRPIVNWLDKYKFFHVIISYFTEDIRIKSDNINKNDKANKRSTIIKMFSVMLFVAFPVPLTGVWTGTCFAVLLGLTFWQVCLSVIVGNLVCGGIIITVCSIFPKATDIILYIFLALMAAGIIYKVIVHILKKKRKNDDKLDNNAKDNKVNSNLSEKDNLEIEDKTNEIEDKNSQDKG